MKPFTITRAEYYRSRNAIFENQSDKKDGFKASSFYCEWIDRILQNYFQQYFSELPVAVTLFALGSYGRVELNPCSDIDILIVYQGDAAQIEDNTKEFIKALWDIGLEVGHQFVNPDQCCELALEDRTTRTTILEMRRIHGSLELANHVEAILNKRVFGNGLREFSSQLLEDTALRHNKYGKSPQLLEPHIKEGVGGLRDLHILLWLFRVNRELQHHFSIKSDLNSSIVNFLNILRDQSLLLVSDADKLIEAFRFLNQVRTQLHLHYTAKHDLLDYGVQKKIAAQLGYTDTDQWLAVEHFMREYYLHTRRIYHAFLILSKKLAQQRKSIQSGKHNQSKKISPAFYILDDEIHLDDRYRQIFTEHPAELMRVFLFRQQHGLRMSESLREAIHYAVNSLTTDIRHDAESIGLFWQILALPDQLAGNLRTMHELNLLDVFLPEFSALTSLAQHDLYHYYSADEHTLIALDNVTKLAKLSPKESHLAEIFHKIQDKRCLFSGILFHDLGKAKKGDHTIIGEKIADDILKKWNIDAETRKRVRFLVRNHQKMEQFAFRRNFEDVSTVREFVKLVGDETNLQLLYLLSYGDLSALNPNVWTEWKSILLMELFKAAKNYMSGKTEEIDIDAEAMQEIALQVQRKLPESQPQSNIVDHLKKMPPHYLDSFDERQIANHLILIKQLSDQVSALHFHDTGSHITITAVTRDLPYCLADICGVLSVNDLNIFSAQIFTRNDGIVVDVFRVIPLSRHLKFDDIQQKDIAEDLSKVLSGTQDLPALFLQHKRRWKRRKFRKTDNPDEIAFDNKISPHNTIIDIFTDDSVGLLYRLALAMAELGLNIQSAKIATRVDQVADSFYVIAKDGGKIEDNARQEKIRQRLIKAIHREF